MFTISCPVSRRRDGRSPLLLAAALAVAVPGLLATACSSQGSTGTARADATAAASSVTAVGAKAVAPRVAEPTATKRKSSARAIQLLAQAAQAAILVTYQGEEVATRWSDGIGSVVVSDIWHASGGQTVTRSLTTGTTFSSQPYLSADSDGQAPEGVLGVTTPLVQLLESHYIVVYAGTGSADDRAAQVVEAWRADGSLAARFWLDSATKLPLEREVYDSTAHVISQDLFINVQFAAQASAQASAPAGAPSDLKGPWSDLMTESQLLALRSHGWVVPTRLPGDLTLFTGAQTTTSTGTVVDLGYSDGLNVVSVFEEHGNLATRLAGWQQTTVAGHVIYVAEPGQRSLTWASKDIVYTVMADAPTQTVDAVIGVLPHDAPPGFWKRISRGLVRLASMVNPFR